MKFTFLAHPGLLAVSSIMLMGPHSIAQDGRGAGAATRQNTEPGQQQQASGTRSQPGRQSSADILPAQFQAAVYEVQGPAERLRALDNKVLTSQAATLETLLSALTQTGKARLLYQFEEPVNVFSSRITVGVSEPIVTGVRRTAKGETLNNISYQNVGVVVLLSAQAPPMTGKRETPTVTTDIKLSLLTPGEEEIAPGQKGVAIRRISMDHTETLELDRPQVVLAVSSNAFTNFRRTADGNRTGETSITPVAYVVRYQFNTLALGSAAVASRSAELPRNAAETTPQTTALAARLQATVYEVEPATNRLPALHAGALQIATTPERMLRSLTEAGKPTVLYQIDQRVNVFSDRVMIMTNVPMVTAVRSASDGEPLKSYTYSNRGLMIRLSAKAPPKEAMRKGPDVTLSFNLAGETSSDTELGLGETCVSCPVIAQEHTEPLELGRSRVMLAMGSASATGQAKPFIYVIRYQFSPANTE